MPRTRSHRIVVIAVTCLCATVVGVTAWATLSNLSLGSSEPSALSPTPMHDLRSQDGQLVIDAPTAAPSHATSRSSAILHAVTRGITFVCDAPALPRAVIAGTTFGTVCTATSVGGYTGSVTITCAAPAWLACDVPAPRANVSPDHAVRVQPSMHVGALAPSGSHTFRLVATTGALSYDAPVSFVVGLNDPTALPTFVCNAWSALVHPGGIVRVPCSLTPRAYAGSVSISCLDASRCHAEPAEFVTTGVTAPIPFDLVLSSAYDALPGDVTDVVRMMGGSAQLHPFVVHVPEVVGTVDVACPLTLAIPHSGTTPLHCTLTSKDGFDGYVRLGATTVLPIGTVTVEPIDVRVPAGQTVDVTLPIVSSGLPLAPLPISVDVTPIAWSAGPVAITLNVLS